MKSLSTRLFDLLKRHTRGAYLTEIDGLRFLAIMPVLLMHVNTSFNKVFLDKFELSGTENSIVKLMHTGVTGVYLFFAISGFILALPFFKHHVGDGKKVSIKHFYLRRLKRLEPPYLIILTGMFIMLLVTEKTFHFGEQIQHYFASFFYVHNAIYQKWSTINPVAWSLEIEVQFYLMVPFLCMLFMKATKKWRLPILIVVLISSTWLSLQYLPFGTLAGFFQYFMAGVICAELYVQKHESKLPRTVIDVLGIIGFVTMFYLEMDKSRAWLPLCILALIYAALYGNIVQKFLRQKWVYVIGGMCYSIYLIHFPVAYVLTKLISPIIGSGSYITYAGIQLALVGSLVLAISAVVYVVLEKPFMNKKS